MKLTHLISLDSLLCKLRTGESTEEIGKFLSTRCLCKIAEKKYSILVNYSDYLNSKLNINEFTNQNAIDHPVFEGIYFHSEKSKFPYVEIVKGKHTIFNRGQYIAKPETGGWWYETYNDLVKFNLQFTNPYLLL